MSRLFASARTILLVCSCRLFVLWFPHPDWVAMETRQSGLGGTGEIKLRDFVKESLRRAGCFKQ